MSCVIVSAMLLTSQHQLEYTPDSERIPVYKQDWFTAIAARGPVLRVEVVEDRTVVGFFSCFLYRNPLGMKQAYNLPWARVCGPCVDAGIDGERRQQIAEKLINQLPKNRSYFLTLSSEDEFRLFLAAGFEGKTEDNFIIPRDQAKVWERGLSRMSRRHLRTAERVLDITSIQPAEFTWLYAEHLAMRRRKPYSDLSIARDLLIEAIRRGQAKVTAARRRDTGEIDAAVACLWDETSYYYWMTTRRPPSEARGAPHAGAVKLLLRAAINHAHAKGLNFDFDGVTSPQVANLYAGMGGTKSVRYKVRRATTCEHLASLVRPPVKSALRNTIGRLTPLKLN
jgi:hypothetical protein